MPSSNAAASLSRPAPRRMAPSILSLGMAAARALSTARRKRKLELGSGPPSRAATANSRPRRVKAAPFLASAVPFLRLIVAQWLCPLMIGVPFYSVISPLAAAIEFNREGQPLTNDYTIGRRKRLEIETKR